MIANMGDRYERLKDWENLELDYKNNNLKKIVEHIFDENSNLSYLDIKNCNFIQIIEAVN